MTQDMVKDKVVNMAPKPATAKPKRQRNRSANRPTYKKVEWVSVDFLRPAMRRLNVTVDELAAALGTSSTSVYKYLDTKRCPKLLKIGVNGLLAESTLPELKGGRNLPALIPPPVTDAVLVVRVPPEQLASARALIGSLGWTTVEQGGV